MVATSHPGVCPGEEKKLLLGLPRLTGKNDT